jgi:hypothetical protein
LLEKGNAGFRETRRRISGKEMQDFAERAGSS